MGGNFVRAAPDSDVTEAAMRSCRLTVQVSTKLNRSHGVTGDQALILPTLGRTEADRGRFVSVEDSMGMIHASRGRLSPASEHLLSEVEIVCRLASATLDLDLGWKAMEQDYGVIRDHISRVIPGFTDFNTRVQDGFALPHAPRDSRTFNTLTGKARLTVNPLEILQVPAGRLVLQTVRSHDQYNTTIYGLDDRYRGVKAGRRVVFVNPSDLAELGFADGDLVNLVSEWEGVERVAPGFRVISYPTSRGCCAAYFPETNVLVPLDSTADVSNTPTSKSVIIRLARP
jgi:anaerobic selenocysteine-containing dehydrogenase